MKIKSIEIKYIKGIDHKKLEFNELIPNKPHILVAPNGFGKSSFAVAFDSMNTRRIVLAKNDIHKNNEAHNPEIKIDVENEDGSVSSLFADQYTNTIATKFDIFVINNKLEAKAKGRNLGGFTTTKASMEVPPIILIDNVPEKIKLAYSIRQAKDTFGSNGKILPNITRILYNPSVFLKIYENADLDLNKFTQVRIPEKINQFISDTNEQSGNSEEIKAWIASHKISSLMQLAPLKGLSSIIKTSNIEGFSSVVDCYLAAIQLGEIYKSDPTVFKKAIQYQIYLGEKQRYTDLIEQFNSTWLDMFLVESRNKRQLEVKFPEAHHISNGERDVLSFVFLLQKAKQKLKKENGILILDEIFDYFDDANLITFQYYIIKFIEECKNEGKNIYPMILTHLNPIFFEHFYFDKHKLKVHFLDKKDNSITPSLKKLIRERDKQDSTLKNDISKYHFHYNPNGINKADEFETLAIRRMWGDSNSYYEFVHDEARKYIEGEADYDPLAVCCSVRIKTEELVYNKILDLEQQAEFLNKHRTIDKLDYASSIAVDVPDTCFLLVPLHSKAMHWNLNRDIISPIVVKLENLTIKYLIKGLYSLT
jgi:hypothetical protein